MPNQDLDSVCMCVSIDLGLSGYLYVHVGTESSGILLTHLLWERFSHYPEAHKFRLDWLASKSQGSHLCLPIATIPSVCHHTWHFYVGSGDMNSGPHVHKYTVNWISHPQGPRSWFLNPTLNTKQVPSKSVQVQSQGNTISLKLFWCNKVKRNRAQQVDQPKGHNRTHAQLD